MASPQLANARTCYDHLAGRLGVRVTDAMVQAGLLAAGDGLALTEPGLDWLRAAGLMAPGRSSRPVARSCLDWTERRPHLAGAAGAAICERFFAEGWIQRAGSGRAVLITESGERALAVFPELASNCNFQGQ